MTGELSKLLDEIKLCQEKDYSFEDLCHTISDPCLDHLSKASEEGLGRNGSQSAVSEGGEATVVQGVPERRGVSASSHLPAWPVSNARLPAALAPTVPGAFLSPRE